MEEGIRNEVDKKKNRKGYYRIDKKKYKGL